MTTKKSELIKQLFSKAIRDNYNHLNSMGIFGSHSISLLNKRNNLFELRCQKIVQKSVTYKKNNLPNFSIELFFKPTNCKNTEEYYNNVSQIDSYKISKSQVNYTFNNINRMKYWATRNGFNIERIFFNVECLCLPHIVDDIIKLSIELKIHNIELVVELTERDEQYDENIIKHCIYNLKDYGISIALDDFLSLLDHRYGIISLVDYVKLVCPSKLHASCWDDFRNLAFYLKERYEKKLVIEKIENSEHTKLLSTIPFDLVQGYHFDKPSCIDNHVFL